MEVGLFMSEYARIERKIWNSLTIQKLSEDTRLVWFYLLSCPQRIFDLKAAALYLGRTVWGILELV
jgi:hypothetical protein